MPAPTRRPATPYAAEPAVDGVRTDGARRNPSTRRFQVDAVGERYPELALRYDRSVLPTGYDPSLATVEFRPVYPGLKDLLLHEQQHPHADIAHVLGVCSAYAYSDADTVSMIMSRMGLERNRCHMIGQYVEAMFIDSTAFLVESEDGEVVILCYRGTQPFNLVNWAANVDVDPRGATLSVAGAAGRFNVHGGFYRNVRATQREVEAALSRALRPGDSVVRDGALKRKDTRPLRALYITGHSLGGAMAALMTVLLLGEERYQPLAEKLRAVYTFGQPMVGDPAFADACQSDEFLARRVLRYVYGDDVVAALPPRLSGRFQHFGQELRCTGTAWHRRASSTGQVRDLELVFAVNGFLPLLAAPLPFVRQITRTFPFSLAGRLFPYSVADHLPDQYLAALAPDKVGSEFGDWR
jgi:hypothetical protein